MRRPGRPERCGNVPLGRHSAGRAPFRASRSVSLGREQTASARPAERARGCRRESFIAVPLSSAGSFDHLVGADGTVRDFCVTGCYGKPAEPEIGESSSFWFDAGFLDDWPPLLNLGLLQSAQRFRRLLLARENLLSEFSKSRTNWRLG